MSVVKKKRSISKLEFQHNAYRMRIEMTELLLRDFGVGSRKNAAVFGDNAPDGKYDEIIAEFSANIRLLLRNLIWNITGGSSLFPSSVDRLLIREQHKLAAIANCERIKDEIQYCQGILPVRASSIVPYIEKVDYQINLLKGWLKSNNKIAARNGWQWHSRGQIDNDPADVKKEETGKNNQSTTGY